MHEFSLLVRFLDQSLTLKDAQEYAYYEAFSLADEFVRRGFASWRKDFDEDAVRIELKKWQSEKNSAVLNRMFGDYRAWLSKPKKML
jgi:hypothetical protein